MGSKVTDNQSRGTAQSEEADPDAAAKQTRCTIMVPSADGSFNVIPLRDNRARAVNYWGLSQVIASGVLDSKTNKGKTEFFRSYSVGTVRNCLLDIGQIVSSMVHSTNASRNWANAGKTAALVFNAIRFREETALKSMMSHLTNTTQLLGERDDSVTTTRVLKGALKSTAKVETKHAVNMLRLLNMTALHCKDNQTMMSVLDIVKKKRPYEVDAVVGSIDEIAFALRGNGSMIGKTIESTVLQEDPIKTFERLRTLARRAIDEGWDVAETSNRVMGTLG